MPISSVSANWFVQITTHPSADLVAAVAGALLAALFAGIAIYTNRKNARDSATIQLIHSTSWDADFIKTRTSFNKLRRDGVIDDCAKRKSGDDFAVIVKTLNYYELMAIGIDENIISGEIYARYFKSRFVLDWLAAKPFVEILRAEHNRGPGEASGKVMWNEYQTLAEQWQVKYNIHS